MGASGEDGQPSAPLYPDRPGNRTYSWHTVPAGDVTAAGAAVSAWPVTVTSGTATKLVWNTVNSLTEDGVIQLRAAFTNGTTTGYSQTTDVTLDRDAGTAPTAQVGPGNVNELTGDYTLSATDAAAFSASVDRTYSSRANSTDTEGQAAVFGPGWTPSVTASGSSVAFTANSTGGWQPETGAKTLTLTGTLTGMSLSTSSPRSSPWTG